VPARIIVSRAIFTPRTQVQQALPNGEITLPSSA